ncbi:MAG: hypothetical protein V7K35_03560 [Nostoc sp.]|uniref:hypothetical protein n=1 Tax=Nostoc sp. TaxID=1180 RepID=UPI002FFCCCE0
MFQDVLTIWGWNSLPFGLTPITLAQEVLTPEEASVLFSDPKILVGLAASKIICVPRGKKNSTLKVLNGISTS